MTLESPPRLGTSPVFLALASMVIACHRPLPPLESGQCWTAAHAEEDETLAAFVASQPRVVARAGQAEVQPADVAQLRRLVLQRHPQVIEAQALVAQARAQRGASGAWPNPELEGRLLLTGPAEGELEGSLGLTLPVSGRLAAGRRAAQLGLDAAELQLESARRQALLDLDGLLAELNHARRTLALHERMAERAAHFSGLARQRLAASMADPLDVSLVLSDAAHAERERIRAQQAEQSLAAQLRQLLGLPASVSLPLPTPTHQHLAEDVRSLQAAAAQSSELRQARLALERAEWQLTQAKRERIPEPTGGPALVRDAESSSLGVSLGLPLPLLAPGGAAQRAAEGQRDAAHEQLILTTRAVTAQVSTLHSRLEALHIELHALAEPTLQAAEQAVILAQERYDAGQLDVLRLLSAHRAYAELQAENLDLLLEYTQNLLALEAAVGRPLQTIPQPLPH